MAQCVRDFLTEYVNHYYRPQIEDAKKRGLIALKEWIERVYEVEEASHLLKCDLSEDCLAVHISESPAISYLRSTGTEPCEYYIEQTRTLYQAVADSVGLDFNLLSYENTGKAEFTFKIK